MSSAAQGAGPGLATYIRANYDAVRDLPAPGTQWVRRMQPEHVRDHLNALIQQTAVESVDTHRNDRSRRHVFETRRSAYEYIEAHEPRSPQLPCGHHGVRNVGDGRFACLFGYCDARFDRETIEEVLAG